MAIDERLRGGAIVVEPGRRHRLFELADRGLAFGNARFELIDPLLVCVRGALTLARLAVDAFLGFS
jgi:hypothetical protein